MNKKMVLTATLLASCLTHQMAQSEEMIPTILNKNAVADEGITLYQAGNYAAAKAIWLPRAQMGDPRANGYMGDYYVEGKAQTPDNEKGLKYLKKGIEKNDSEAQFRMGVLYFDGQGVPKDHVKAFEYFKKAAYQGHIYAITNVALAYSRGDGTAANPQEAAKLFRILANPDYVRNSNDINVSNPVSGSLVELSKFYSGNAGIVPKNMTVAYALVLESEAIKPNQEAEQIINSFHSTLNSRQENNAHYLQFELNRKNNFYNIIDTYAVKPE